MSSRPNSLASRQPILSERIEDADTFGVMVVVTPEEAERQGAFVEDALSEDDAWDSQVDGEDAANG